MRLILVIFCCCLCDCRIPKTTYDKEEKPQEDSDCSDIEPAVTIRQAPVVTQKQEPEGEKMLVNGSSPQERHRGSRKHEKQILLSRTTAKILLCIMKTG